MREVKIYNNHYSGKYYCIPLISKGDVIRAKFTGDVENLSFEQVDRDDLIIGETYFNETGSAVKLVDNDAYEVVERTPLRVGYTIDKLNDLQTILFWTLVINCKNGTYSGV